MFLHLYRKMNPTQQGESNKEMCSLFANPIFRGIVLDDRVVEANRGHILYPNRQ